MTMQTRYIADDGKEFESVAACAEHERQCALARLRERSMKSYIASDYAGLKLPGGAELYYGYEVTQGKAELQLEIRRLAQHPTLTNQARLLLQLADAVAGGEITLEEGCAQLREKQTNPATP